MSGSDLFKRMQRIRDATTTGSSSLYNPRSSPNIRSGSQGSYAASLSLRGGPTSYSERLAQSYALYSQSGLPDGYTAPGGSGQSSKRTSAPVVNLQSTPRVRDTGSARVERPSDVLSASLRPPSMPGHLYEFDQRSATARRARQRSGKPAQKVVVSKVQLVRSVRPGGHTRTSRLPSAARSSRGGGPSPPPVHGSEGAPGSRKPSAGRTRRGSLGRTAGRQRRGVVGRRPGSRRGSVGSARGSLKRTTRTSSAKGSRSSVKRSATLASTTKLRRRGSKSGKPRPPLARTTRPATRHSSTKHRSARGKATASAKKRGKRAASAFVRRLRKATQGPRAPAASTSRPAGQSFRSPTVASRNRRHTQKKPARPAHRLPPTHPTPQQQDWVQRNRKLVYGSKKQKQSGKTQVARQQRDVFSASELLTPSLGPGKGAVPSVQRNQSEPPSVPAGGLVDVFSRTPIPEMNIAADTEPVASGSPPYGADIDVVVTPAAPRQSTPRRRDFTPVHSAVSVEDVKKLRLEAALWLREAVESKEEPLYVPEWFLDERTPGLDEYRRLYLRLVQAHTDRQKSVAAVAQVQQRWRTACESLYPQAVMRFAKLCSQLVRAKKVCMSLKIWRYYRRYRIELAEQLYFRKLMAGKAGAQGKTSDRRSGRKTPDTLAMLDDATAELRVPDGPFRNFKNPFQDIYAGRKSPWTVLPDQTYVALAATRSPGERLKVFGFALKSELDEEHKQESDERNLGEVESAHPMHSRFSDYQMLQVQCPRGRPPFPANWSFPSPYLPARFFLSLFPRVSLAAFARDIDNPWFADVHRARRLLAMRRQAMQQSGLSDDFSDGLIRLHNSNAQLKYTVHPLWYRYTEVCDQSVRQWRSSIESLRARQTKPDVHSRTSTYQHIRDQMARTGDLSNGTATAVNQAPANDGSDVPDGYALFESPDDDELMMLLKVDVDHSATKKQDPKTTAAGGDAGKEAATAARGLSVDVPAADGALPDNDIDHYLTSISPTYAMLAAKRDGSTPFHTELPQLGGGDQLLLMGDELNRMQDVVGSRSSDDESSVFMLDEWKEEADQGGHKAGGDGNDQGLFGPPDDAELRNMSPMVLVKSPDARRRIRSSATESPVQRSQAVPAKSAGKKSGKGKKRSARTRRVERSPPVVPSSPLSGPSPPTPSVEGAKTLDDVFQAQESNEKSASPEVRSSSPPSRPVSSRRASRVGQRYQVRKVKKESSAADSAAGPAPPDDSDSVMSPLDLGQASAPPSKTTPANARSPRRQSRMVTGRQARSPRGGRKRLSLAQRAGRVGRSRPSTAATRISNPVPRAVKIVSGRQLAAKDMSGTSDPYILLDLVDSKHRSLLTAAQRKKLKSPKIMRTLNPVWPHCVFHFAPQKQPPKQPASSSRKKKNAGDAVAVDLTSWSHAQQQQLYAIKVECWDWDRVFSDDFMGVGYIPLRSGPMARTSLFRVDMQPRKGKKGSKDQVSGFIRVKVEFEKGKPVPPEPEESPSKGRDRSASRSRTSRSRRSRSSRSAPGADQDLDTEDWDDGADAPLSDVGEDDEKSTGEGGSDSEEPGEISAEEHEAWDDSETQRVFQFVLQQVPEEWRPLNVEYNPEELVALAEALPGDQKVRDELGDDPAVIVAKGELWGMMSDPGEQKAVSYVRQLLDHMRSDADCTKLGRWGSGHRSKLYVLEGFLHWNWEPWKELGPSKKCIPLLECKSVDPGRSATRLLTKKTKSNQDELCFAVLSPDKDLSIVCDSREDRDLWVLGLRNAIRFAREAVRICRRSFQADSDEDV